jgi:hypothetical protein
MQKQTIFVGGPGVIIVGCPGAASLEFGLSHFQANPNFIWMPNSNSVDVPFGMSNGAP